MLRNGVDIFALQKLMGHSDLQILRRYLAQTDQDIHTAHMRGSLWMAICKGSVHYMKQLLTSSIKCLYIHTYIEYNISMNVKTDLPRIDKLRQIMKSRQGLLTSDLANFNIPRTYLSIMEQSGEIERVSRGAYRSASALLRMNCSASSLNMAPRSFHTRPPYTCMT